MATSTLQVIVETNTRQLDQLTSKFKKTETQLSKLQGKLKAGLVSGFRAAGNAGQAAARKIQAGFKRAADSAAALSNKLSNTRVQLAALGTAAGLGFAAKAAASFEQTQLRLQLLSKEYGEFDRIQKLVTQNATTFNQSQKESAENFANVYARLRPLGKSLDEIQTTYEGFNAVAIASGASAQEASSAFLQLSQALGSGRLQGDEFRSISEQVPGILKLVSTELGVTVGELKKLGSEGKITSDVLINALAKGFDENKDAIADLIALSPAQKFKAFQNSLTELSVAVGQELLPVLIPLTQQATKLIQAFGQLPGPVKTAAVAVTALGTAFVLLAPPISAALGFLTKFAPAAVAAGGGAKVLAGGLALVKGAVTALLGPWGLLIAGLTAVGVAAVSATNRINDMQAKMNDLSGSSTTLQGRIVDVQNEIARLEGNMEGAGNSARGMKRKVDELRAALENLEGQYSVQIAIETFLSGQGVDVKSIGEGFYGPGGAAPKPKPKAVTPTIPTGGGSSGGGGGGGGGGATRESEIPALTRQLKLSDELLQIDRARLEAQFQGNTARIQELSELRIITELEGKRADIEAEAIPAAEQKLKIQLAENEAALAGLELKYQSLEAEKQRKEVLEGVLSPIQDEIELLQGKLAGNEEEIRQKQEILRLEKAIANAGGDPSQAAGLVKSRDALKELSEQQDATKAKAEQLAGAISGALTDSLRGLIDGSMSAEEALANAFQGIADAFIDMAMQMIQEWLKMQLLGIIGGAFGGGGAISGGGGGFGAGTFNLSGGQFGAFAEGGYVTGPTNALIGEGGESEYVIPASKMTNAMSNYSMGKRGGSILDDPSGEGNAEGGGSGMINVSYDVERINEVNYVTEEAFITGMNSAAKRGADQGNAKTMGQLRNSRSQRAKLGMNR